MWRSLPILFVLACAPTAASESPMSSAAQSTTATPTALRPCPNSPNCVSSHADPADAEHHIAPLSWTGELPQAQAALRGLVLAMPRTKLTDERDGYLSFTFTSRIWRFRDDVEFLFAPDGVLHVRSASRVGHDDLGANRKRVEAVRVAWSQRG